MAGVGQKSGRIPCRQYPATRGRHRFAVAGIIEAENNWRVVRSDDFRCSPGLRGLSCLDFRDEEYTLAGVLPLEHFVVSALRRRAISPTVVLLGFADGVHPRIAEQDFDRDAAHGAAA